MSFSKISFTNAGRALQAKALAGTPLVFTKIALGSGSLNGRDPATFTSLLELKVSLSISKTTRDGQQVMLEANFSNQDNNTGFYWREVGLFANDPTLGEILYCYGNAGNVAEYIQPSTSSSIEKVITLTAVVGNAQNVTAIINTAAFATKKDISAMTMSLSEVNSKLAQKVNKEEVTNGMHPKGEIAYASLPMVGNEVGDYYYCQDGDGTNPSGNYAWNGTSWYFAGTGDEGYNKVSNEIVEQMKILTIPQDVAFYSGDLYVDLEFFQNRIGANNNTTVYNYESYVVTSEVATHSSPVKIRNNSGKVVDIKLENVTSAVLGANLGYTFDKNGRYITNFKTTEIENAITDPNAYYAIFLKYTNAPNMKMLYSNTNGYIEKQISKAIKNSNFQKEHETYHVGIGQEYVTLTSCLTSLSGNDNNKVIYVYGGIYDIYSEIGGDTFANAIQNGANWADVSVIIPKNTKLIGVGNVVFNFLPGSNINEKAVDLLSPLNARGSVDIENINIYCQNCRYAIHFEGSKLDEYNGSVYSLKNVEIVKYASTKNIAAIGVGLNNDCTLKIENCKIDNRGTSYSIYAHDNYNNPENSPKIEITSTILLSGSSTTILLDNFGGGDEATSCVIPVKLTNCYTHKKINKRANKEGARDIYKLTLMGCNNTEIGTTGDYAISNLIDHSVYNMV